MAAAVLACDQAAKLAALRGLAEGETVPVVSPFFHLTLVKNTGIAFGLLRGGSPFLAAFISGSLAVLAALVPLFAARHPIERWAFALILGGALGNFMDRMRLGYVVDFLDFRVWPVFNIADVCISVGVGLFVLSLVRGEHHVSRPL